MTIAEARAALADNAYGLTDNEMQEIIDWLNMMAEVIIDSLNRSKKKEIPTLPQPNNRSVF
jgi:hypothetical protein